MRLAESIALESEPLCFLVKLVHVSTNKQLEPLQRPVYEAKRVCVLVKRKIPYHRQQCDYFRHHSFRVHVYEAGYSDVGSEHFIELIGERLKEGQMVVEFFI